MEYFKKAQLSDRIFLGEKKNSTAPSFILRLTPENLPKDFRLWKDFLDKKTGLGCAIF